MKLCTEETGGGMGSPITLLYETVLQLYTNSCQCPLYYSGSMDQQKKAKVYKWMFWVNLTWVDASLKPLPTAGCHEWPCAYLCAHSVLLLSPLLHAAVANIHRHSGTRLLSLVWLILTSVCSLLFLHLYQHRGEGLTKSYSVRIKYQHSFRILENTTKRSTTSKVVNHLFGDIAAFLSSQITYRNFKYIWSSFYSMSTAKYIDSEKYYYWACLVLLSCISFTWSSWSRVLQDLIWGSWSLCFTACWKLHEHSSGRTPWQSAVAQPLLSAVSLWHLSLLVPWMFRFLICLNP